MKIYNLFNEKELNILAQNDYIIENREYSFDEIDNILRNIIDEHFFEKQRKGELKDSYKNIISKLKKVEKEMPEYFDLRKWKHRKITTTEELKRFFIEENIIGKKIIKINFCGNPESLNKNRMINLYNNDKELMKNDNWWLMRKITPKYIPDNITKSLITQFDFPLVIEFNDGNTIEVLSRNHGCYLISANKIKNPEVYSSEIIGSKFFESIINVPINDLKIETYENENDWRYNAIKKEYKAESNPKKIKIIFDNDLKLEVIDNLVGISNIENEFLEISIGKYKKCIKHYEWLFSKKAEKRGDKCSEEKADSKEFTEDDKDLVCLLRALDIPKGDIIHIAIMMNATNNSGILVDWLIKEIEKGELEITTSKIYEKILELIGKLRK